MSATQIAGQITSPTDISAVQALGNSIATNVATPISPAAFTFWAGFDGTNNIASDPAYSGDTQSTAVGALYKQISDASQATSNTNVGVGYYAGVGTPGTLPGSSVFPTQQAIATATQAYDEFAAKAETWLQTNPGGQVTTMLASFSRGSIAAAVFSQMLYEKGLVALDGTMLVPPGQVGVSAGLIISPVNTGGNGDVPFAPNVKNMVEIVAANEYRIAYEQDIYAGFKRIDLLGNHGDVGGFYPGGLGSMYLQNYTDFFNAANPGMAANVLPTRQYTGGALDIHVETFSPANPQNLSVGSYAEGSTIGTSTINPLGISEVTGTGDIFKYVDYQGETVVMQRVGGMVQSVTRTLPAAGSITTHYDAGTGVTTQTVDTTLNGNALNVTYTYDASGQPIPHVNSINGAAPTDQAAADAAFENTGILPGQLMYGDSGVAGTDVGSVVSTFDATNPSGAQTLTNAINQYGGTLIDALSLIKAIQSGDPLPIAVSGLRLANDISNLAGLANYNLSGAASVGGSILSILSLQQALQRGDTLAAVTAGAQTLSFGANAYLNFAVNNPSISITTASDINLFLNGTAPVYKDGVMVIPGDPGVLPYLNLVNSIANGDAVGAAIGAAQIANMTGLYAIPGINVIAIAYTVFNIVSSLFGDEDTPPEPWGNAWAGWSGFSAVTNSSGGDGGQGAAADTYNGFISYLNQLAASEQARNPGSAIGIVANRLPSITYRNYSGFQLTDIDPLTGVQRNPEIKYDLTGRPYNAPAGSDQASQSMSERFIRVALARSAIAPLWEAQTAALQTQAGDPQAGLTEEERAGRNGKLAHSPQPSPVSPVRAALLPLSAGTLLAGAGGGSKAFRAVALDLNGDGVQTTGAARTVAFDVDDSGFLKNTAWLSNSDGFLFLDRNLNGGIDSGRELFSNGIVTLGARGLAGMCWIDSNYDGKLTNADPVWNELKVWQDANGDGVAEAGETQTLSALGITALDYAMGRFEQNGQLKEMSSPDLAADTQGTRTHVVPEANQDGVEAANESMYFYERMAA